MKIMSLNVNQFAGRGNFKDTKNLEALNGNAREIIALVKGFLLGNDNGIVILQEVPCWDFGRRCTRRLYDCFCAEFDRTLFEIFEPAELHAHIVTLAITNRGAGWNKIYDFAERVADFKNKFLEMEDRKGRRLVGVHMPICPENEKENRKFWRDFLVYVSSPQKPVLAGDFNAYEAGCDYNGEEYTALLKSGYCDLVPAYAVTYIGGTKIDHILVPEGESNSGAKVLTVAFSDHAAVVGNV